MVAWFLSFTTYTQENIAMHGIYLELITQQESFPSFEKEDTDKIRR